MESMELDRGRGYPVAMSAARITSSPPRQPTIKRSASGVTQTQTPQPAAPEPAFTERLKEHVLTFVSRPRLQKETADDPDYARVANQVLDQLTKRPGETVRVFLLPSSAEWRAEDEYGSTWCMTPTADQMGLLAGNSATQNAQLSGMGIGVEFQTAMSPHEVPGEAPVVKVLFCNGAFSWNGETLQIGRLDSPLVFHEVAHVLGASHPSMYQFGLVPQDSAAYTGLDEAGRVLADHVCAGGSLMVEYNVECGVWGKGYMTKPGHQSYPPIDLCTFKHLLTTDPEERKAAVDKCADGVVDHILGKEPDLTPAILGAFTSSTVAGVVEGLLNEFFVRAVSDTGKIEQLRKVSRCVAGLVQLTLLWQMGVTKLGAQAAIAGAGAFLGSGLADSLPLTKTLRALLKGTGCLNIAVTIVGVLNGRVESFAALGGAVAGQLAGNCVAQVLSKVLDICIPIAEEEKRQYLARRSAHPTADAATDAAMPWAAKAGAKYDKLAAWVAESAALKALAVFDAGIGALIDSILTLNVLRNYMFVADATEAAEMTDIPKNLEKVVVDAENAASEAEKGAGTADPAPVHPGRGSSSIMGLI